MSIRLYKVWKNMPASMKAVMRSTWPRTDPCVMSCMELLLPDDDAVAVGVHPRARPDGQPGEAHGHVGLRGVQALLALLRVGRQRLDADRLGGQLSGVAHAAEHQQARPVVL